MHLYPTIPLAAALALAFATLAPREARATDTVYTIHVKGRAFTPARLDVAAGTRFDIVVINDGDDPDEFDSYPLNRHKHLLPRGRTTVHLGPLAAGEFPFTGRKVAVGLVPETAPGKGDARMVVEQARGRIVVR